jgi:hypothetical protein
MFSSVLSISVSKTFNYVHINAVFKIKKLYLLISIKSCDTSVGIALGYRLDDRGSRV